MYQQELGEQMEAIGLFRNGLQEVMIIIFKREKNGVQNTDK